RGVAERRRAHVRDDQGGVLRHGREQVLADLVGVGDIYLSGQRHDGETAAPDDMPVTRHGPSPPVHTRREGGPRLWTREAATLTRATAHGILAPARRPRKRPARRG